MADEPESSKIGIPHLFAATLCVGVVFALARLDRQLQVDLPTHFSPLEFLSLLGQGLGLTTLFLSWDDWRSGRSFAKQPGYLVGILIGSVIVLDQGSKSIAFLSAGFTETCSVYEANQFQAWASYLCATGLLLAAAHHASTAGNWRLCFYTAAAACGTETIKCAFYVWPNLPWELHFVAIIPARWLFVVAAIAFAASTLRDLRKHAPRRDWRHWTGVASAHLFLWPKLLATGIRSLLH